MNRLVIRYDRKINDLMIATLSDSCLQDDAFSPNALHHNFHKDLSLSIDNIEDQS